MKTRCVAFTHQGVERPSNDDCLLVGGWLRRTPMDEPLCFDFWTRSSTLFAVADGLGGHASGEIASQFALSRLETLLKSRHSLDEFVVAQALQQVHVELVELSNAIPSYRGMGTTIAGLLLDNEHTTLFHVGDSRVYRREDRFLQLMTADDRAHERAYGEIDDREGNKLLLQCLGAQTVFSKISPHVTLLPAVTTKETFLLCTDGLFDMMPLDQMEACISDEHETSVRKLFQQACLAGGRDNVSIMMLEVTLQQDDGRREVSSNEVPQ